MILRVDRSFGRTRLRAAPVWGEANLRLAIEAAGVALWSWNVDSDKLTTDEPGYL